MKLIYVILVGFIVAGNTLPPSYDGSAKVLNCANY